MGEVYLSAALRGRNLFGVYAAGDCMTPMIAPGDVVVYEPATEWQEGQLLVLQRVEDPHPVVKWAIHDPETGALSLRSLNEPDMPATEGTRVIGTVRYIVKEPVPAGAAGGRRLQLVPTPDDADEGTAPDPV